MAAIDECVDVWLKRYPDHTNRKEAIVEVMRFSFAVNSFVLAASSFIDASAEFGTAVGNLHEALERVSRQVRFADADKDPLAALAVFYAKRAGSILR